MHGCLRYLNSIRDEIVLEIMFLEKVKYFNLFKGETGAGNTGQVVTLHF